jgi:hypothetical protein
MMQHATSHRVSSDAHFSTVPIGDRLALQAVLDDLNAWISEERQTWVSLQDSAGTTLRDAMSLGVRLASFVSDSEKRLADGVDQSNQATNSSVTVLSRIVEAAERFEQGMPQLSQLIERHAHRQHEEDETCNRLSRLTEAAEAVTLALRDAGSSAVEQIEAMGDVAGRMRQDSTALDVACRQVATFGANIVMQAHDAIIQIDAAVTSLPKIILDISAEAGLAVTTLSTAAALLRDEQIAFLAAIRQSAVAEKRITLLIDQMASTAELIDRRLEQLILVTESIREKGAMTDCASASLTAAVAEAATSSGVFLSAVERASIMVVKLHEEASRLDEASRLCSESGRVVVQETRSAVQSFGSALPQLDKYFTHILNSFRLEVQSLVREIGDLSETSRRAGEAIAGSLVSFEEKSGALSLTIPLLDSRLREMRSTLDDIHFASVTAISRLERDLQRSLSETYESLIGTALHVSQAGRSVAEGLRDHSSVLIDQIGEASGVLRGDASLLSARGHDLGRILEAMHLQTTQLHQASAAAQAVTRATIEDVLAEHQTGTGSMSRMEVALVRLEALPGRVEQVLYDGVGRPGQSAAPELVMRLQDLEASLSKGLTSHVAMDIEMRIGSMAGRIDRAVSAIDDFASLQPRLREVLAELPISVTNAIGHQLSSLRQLQQEMSMTMNQLSSWSLQLAASAQCIEASEPLSPARSDTALSAIENRATAYPCDTDAAAISAAPIATKDKLRDLSVIDAQLSALMFESESWVEVAVFGPPDAAPDWLCGRAAEILKLIDISIARLRSVATAVALASDAVETKSVV